MSDLKVELKRRNLPVSGSKPQLIERLKPFTESSTSNNLISNSNGPHVTHMGHILMDTPGPMATDESNCQARSPCSIVKDEPHSPRTASPHSSEHDDPSSPPGKETFCRYIFSLRTRAPGTICLVHAYIGIYTREVMRFSSEAIDSKDSKRPWVSLRRVSSFRR